MKLLIYINNCWTLKGAMLSCTFINSHSQLSDQGVEDCCDNGYTPIPWNCPSRNGAISLANPFNSLAGMGSGPDDLLGSACVGALPRLLY